MKKITKIGILVSGFPPTTIGGVEIATQKIAQLLSERHLEVHLIMRNVRFNINGQKRSLKKIEKYQGYIIHRIPCVSSSIFRFITHVFFGLKKLIEIKPDIIHAQQLTPNGLIAIVGGKILRKKTLVWIRGSEFYNSSSIYLKSLGKFIISRANIVLAISHHMKQQMKRLWPQKSIFTLGNGITLENYFHDPTPKTYIEIIFVGRLIKNKRVSDALFAISNLKDHILPIIFTIIGSGTMEKPLRKECILLNITEHVQFLGEISPSKIPTYLSKADLFIFPSISEGLPNAILEAMASSLPILAARITAIPELVHDNINGLLHSPGDIKELSENLNTLIQDENLRKLMGQKSYQLAQNYSWKKIINKLLNFYFNM